MKIGIITVHSAHNYGTVLQAWALQQYLKKQGHEVEIVNLRLPIIDKLYRLTYKTNKKVCKSSLVNRAANAGYYYLRSTVKCLREPGKYQKYKKFEYFINHELNVTREFHSCESLEKADLQYDALIAGSDQIWNPVMLKGVIPAYFLHFGNRDALRISYAASIGTEEIPPEYHLLFQRYLRDLDFISVREKTAQEEIRKLTEKPVSLVADPTFLIASEEFDTLKKKPSVVSGKYIYVHNVHLKRIDNALVGVGEELSKRLNLPVIHNGKQKLFSNEMGRFSGGVEEFLSLVSEADYVITNSFHCTVFSIVYHQNFITVPPFRYSDRMRNLLEELGIPEHLIGDWRDIPEDLSALKIDYQAVEEKKAVMSASGKEFLKHALESQKSLNDGTYFEHPEVFRCYGCSACADVCPSKAIRMEADAEGFCYPVIHEELCMHCHECRDVCIYHNELIKNAKEKSLPVVYAAYHKDHKVVKGSTNGGVFTAMYQKFLEMGGKVAGVRYDEEMKVVYDIAEDEEGCKQFCGTKHVFADCSDVKPRVKEFLEAGQAVLFSGTPCQIAGLKSFLRKDYERLYTVEVICSGGGSQKVFREYCRHLEEMYESKLVHLEFGNKFKGAATPFMLYEFESGSIGVENAAKNNFGRAFLDGNIQRPSCYTCEFVGLKEGVADLTIGEYRGVKKQHPDFENAAGVSLVKINTEKGKSFWEGFRDELETKKSTCEAAYAANRTEPLRMKAGRSKLMYELDEKPIDDLLAEFNHLRKHK